MKEVSISGHAIRDKTKAGRDIQVLRSDDGSHWGFKFGPDGDQISFALSAEALEIMLSMIRSLKPPTKTQWVVEFDAEG